MEIEYRTVINIRKFQKFLNFKRAHIAIFMGYVFDWIISVVLCTI